MKLEQPNIIAGFSPKQVEYVSRLVIELNRLVELTGSATYNPASLADGAGATTTVSVIGARLGDIAAASFSLDLQGIILTAYVSASDVVSVRFQNESGGVLDLAEGTLRVRVFKQ